MLGVVGSVVGIAGGGNGDVGKFGIGGGLVSNVRSTAETIRNQVSV
jgi:hypothetical protein